MLVAGLLLAACTTGATVSSDEPGDAVVPDGPSDDAISESSPPPSRPVEPADTPETREPPEPVEPEPTTRPYEPLPDDVALARELVAELPEQITTLATRGGDDRIFAGDKQGRIWVVEDGQVDETPFLDLSDHVRGTSQLEEQGLLSIAFHPDASDDDRFFAYFVTADSDDTRLAVYRVDDDLEVDPASGQTVLDVEQPFRWHNGGQLVFGPDGMLWLSLGDGGLSGDPHLYAQDPQSHLGSILRIDVPAESADDDPPYLIPDDNPFADGVDGAPEVWAYGLRNPWRMAIDAVDWTVYVADVGQHRFEWINVVGPEEGGANFGWPIVEATTCYPDHADRCPGEGFTDPTLEYARGDAGACAVIGGEVYEGTQIPELAGHYLYGDLCAGFVRSFRYVDGDLRDERDWTDQLGAFDTMVTFGTDPDDELLVSDQQGAIWRIVPATP